jgi:hypothetical protein
VSGTGQSAFPSKYHGVAANQKDGSLAVWTRLLINFDSLINTHLVESRFVPGLHQGAYIRAGEFQSEVRTTSRVLVAFSLAHP